AGRSAGAGPLVVAVDVPSGIGTDDGAAPGPILRADLTVTMGAPKPGLLIDPARRYAGRVETADIGLGLSAAARAAGCAALDVADIDSGFPSPDLVSIERADLPLLWPVPGPSSHKYTRGVVGVAAGSASYPGAGFLCVDAALAAGPGMVRYAGTLGSAVVSSCPEAVLGEGRVDAWVIGPGLDREALARAEPIVDGLRSGGWTAPAVLDAGALAWAERGMTPATVLTPHAGELAVLFSRLGIEGSREGIAACPAAAAKLASEFTGATVVLKGPVDVVVSPGSPVYAQSGTAWRAVAGAGDVYAGLLGALLAAGLEPARAAAAAACVHGLASENGPMRASDIVRNVPAVVRAALAGGGSEEGSGYHAPGASAWTFGAPGASASAFHMRRARVSGGRRGAGDVPGKPGEEGTRERRPASHAEN
ncbi:MAG: bifunctional ADP-dependent NAD(P)H-hydrate dehydratase/NAD(P)H-hydrate epimerase, partial [Peptidiphaga gingivicola]